MASTIIYSDLDLRFLPNPVTGDISMSYNEQAVIRSIKNILYTAQDSSQTMSQEQQFIS